MRRRRRGRCEMLVRTRRFYFLPDDLHRPRSVPRLGRLQTRHVLSVLDCLRALRGVFQLLPLVLTGWLNRQGRDALAYLMEENRVLRRQLGTRRGRMTYYTVFVIE